MRRVRSKAKINTRLILDVVLASIIVQKAPAFISKIVPIDPSVQSLAGIGAGYLTGVLMKRPDIANASIALGATDFINPLIDSITGTVTGAPLPAGNNQTTGIPMGIKTEAPGTVSIRDFITLNDYIKTPGVSQDYYSYMSSY